VDAGWSGVVPAHKESAFGPVIHALTWPAALFLDQETTMPPQASPLA
jgi:hypothetical protein